MCHSIVLFRGVKTVQIERDNNIKIVECACSLSVLKDVQYQHHI